MLYEDKDQVALKPAEKNASITGENTEATIGPVTLIAEEKPVSVY